MQTDFYHDTERNILVYKTQEPERLVQYVPDAKQINGSFVSVPRNLYNSQLLRWLNYPVVPIMDHYSFPHGPDIEHPTQAQKLMANFCVLHPKCFNLSDMGTMKTLATLWAADWLMDQYEKGTCRAIIVAPLSILQRVWGDAIFKNFIGKRTYAIVYGNARKRQEILATPADFYIINYDGLGIGAHTRKRFELDGLSKNIFDRPDIRIAIIDEASAYRDSRTKRSRIARLLLAGRDYLWLLTGTPTPNGPTDAYGMAKLVNNAFGETYTSFHRRTMMQVSTFKWIPQRDGYEEARKLLRPSIRFDIKDVWDGPALTTQQRQVELTDEQKKAMHELKRSLQVMVKSGPITAVNEAAARTKFIQISLGAIYDQAHNWHLIDSKPRLAELRSVIEQASGKLLAFAPLTSVIDLLYSTLKEEQSCAIVNGNVSQADRNRIFAGFQHEAEPRILIADPGTMAHGLDLWQAQTVVWYGPTDKTELYLQANKRAHRPGQKYPVTIVQIVSTQLEREIFKRLENNQSMQGLMLEMVRQDKL